MNALTGTRVLVVGSGFGGLSTACYLAAGGADVTVLERNDSLGGRASVLERDGFRFDMGPSWYLMPDVFERFFGHFDRTPSDYYRLERLDPHYRIFFKDDAGPRPRSDAPGLTRGEDRTVLGSQDSGEQVGDVIDITPDREQAKQLFEAYEPGAGEALERYLEQSKENYEVGMEHFVYEDRTRLRDFLDPRLVTYARGLSLLGSMQDHVERYFDHPKLQQVMQYTLVFLGGSPENTPALYNLMSHVDFGLGVYYPEYVDEQRSSARQTESAGGMGGVVDGIVEMATELGVTFETNAEVTSIRGRRGDFTVETAAAGTFHGDVVVSNADYAHTEQELLAPADRQYDAEYWDDRTYAPSAFLLYLGVEGDLPDLAHHSLVLPADWTDHFDQIFDDPAWPEDPAYYVCAPSKTDDTVAPPGHSNLFVLVPVAPGLDDTEETRAWYRDLVLDDLARYTGTDLRDRIVLEECFTVSDFADRYNAQEGTALGLAHTLRQTALFRPPHRSSALDGLYFTGAYTTPGIGVPMCLISGELTADEIIEDD